MRCCDEIKYSYPKWKSSWEKNIYNNANKNNNVSCYNNRYLSSLLYHMVCSVQTNAVCAR